MTYETLKTLFQKTWPNVPEDKIFEYLQWHFAKMEADEMLDLSVKDLARAICDGDNLMVYIRTEEELMEYFYDCFEFFDHYYDPCDSANPAHNPDMLNAEQRYQLDDICMMLNDIQIDPPLR